MLSVLDIYYWVSKSGPDDVRWEKVEYIKRILTGGTYPVPPQQVAAKFLEHMLEGRPNDRWERSGSRGKANDSSGFGKATKRNKRYEDKQAKASKQAAKVK
jgi:Anti-sigma-28 factor, FlgM